MSLIDGLFVSRSADSSVAPQSDRERSASTQRLATLDVAWLLAILVPIGFFSFRSGVPGMRHDWVWPGESSGFVRWFVDAGISQWNPSGLGNSGQVSSFNFVFAPLAILGLAHVPSAFVLFGLLASCFIGAFYGLRMLIAVLDVRVEPTVTRALAFSYAFGPVAFQKTVAGHFFWLAAYAALPWFAACVWSGARRAESDQRAFGMAALLYALSTTQIQFAVFDAMIMIAIVLAHGARPRACLGIAFVLAVGMLHNANAIRGPFGPPEAFDLARSHATEVWERDMSTPFFDAARYAGYVGYDRLALSPPVRSVFDIVTVVIAFGAVAGIVIARDRRAIVFGSLAIITLSFVAGWYGPLANPLSWALTHVGEFTVFRELYHAMAIYALCSIILLALALVPLRRAGTPVALAIAAASTIPFWTDGLSKLIPAVRLDASEKQRNPFQSRLQVLLPYQQPLGVPGMASAGIDPARFVGDDATAGGVPFPLRAALDASIPLANQRALLADAGVARVGWRQDRISVLPSSFEPGVGAHFERFITDERRMHDRYVGGVAIAASRAALELEDRANVDSLAAFVADATLPPGRSVPVDSSFVGNSIREQWVSGELWSWFAPNLANVVSQPVLTESPAPLTLAVRANAGDTVYILAAANLPRIDGVPVTADGVWRSGRYAWYSKRLNAARSKIAFSALGLTSVARCVISPMTNWRAPEQAIKMMPPTVLAYRQSVPWSATTTVPPTTSQMRLVYARTFAPGWHLRLAGADVGEARRFDGIFMGWLVPPSPAARSAELTYAPQATSGLLVAIDVGVDLALLAFLLQPLISARLRSCV